jgi:hypothetical protein
MHIIVVQWLLLKIFSFHLFLYFFFNFCSIAV